MQHLQSPVKQRKVCTGFQSLINTHSHQIREAVFFSVFHAAHDVMRLPAVSGAAAIRAGDIYIREELDVQ